MIGPTKRILCANLNEDFCDLVEQLLAPHEVINTKTIDDALAQASGQKFDLYVLNHQLHDGSGIRLAHLLKTLDPQALIVFVTASRSISEAQAQNVGAIALIHLETGDFVQEFQAIVAQHLNISTEALPQP